jgi:sporulation protein YlmC with PRC-barrel domain
LGRLLIDRCADVFRGTEEKILSMIVQCCDQLRMTSWNGRCGDGFSSDHSTSGRNHMSVRYIPAALAASALLGSVAFAQTPTATTDRMAPSEMSSSLHGDWRASKVVGLNVYNDSNQNIGSINDLLMDKSGNIKAAVIGVGGFLGVGEHLVAIAFEKVKFVNEPVPYTGTAGNSSSNPPTTTGSASTATASKPVPWHPDHAVFNATKDELKAMPEFKYSS